MKFANCEKFAPVEARENCGLDTNVKAGKFGGAEGFHGGAKISGVLSARIVERLPGH